MSAVLPDSELKARHRAMWASGDYPQMVETFLTPLGPRLVDACRIGPGVRVLDVASGTGNAQMYSDGVQFLDALRRRGRLDGWEVGLSAISPAARTVLEQAGWIHPVLHSL